MHRRSCPHTVPRGAGIDTSTELNFRNRDPWAAFVRDRLRWSPRRYGIAILLLNATIDITAAALLGAFITEAGPPGLLQDPPTLLIDFIMMPSIGAFYIWSTVQIRSLVKQLYDANVISDTRAISRAVDDLSHSLGRGLATGLSVVIAVIITLLFAGSYLGWYPWSQLISFFNQSVGLIWLRSAMWFGTIYGLSLGLFNVAVITIALRRLFRQQSIDISPWHPDHCGGLRSISQFSMALGYAIAAVGITVSVQTIREIQLGTFATSYFTWFGLGAYIVLSPLAFFLPLGTAHAAMNQAKKSHLLSLSRQFDVEYRRITQALENEERGIRESVERIEGLQSLYKITAEFTIWPFDVGNLRRFLTITLVPVIPGLFTVAIELAKLMFPS